MDKNPGGMIDVGDKKITKRFAKARSSVILNSDIIKMIKEKTLPKGDVLQFARVAGIMAGKNTCNLIPLCHPIEIEQITVDFDIIDNSIIIESTAKTTAKTGIEMEAMVAANIAALTIYDMCKMFSKEIEVTNSWLLEKSGGRSGLYIKP
jgi:cyclic pyranopterin monophosphate synthase